MTFKQSTKFISRDIRDEHGEIALREDYTFTSDEDNSRYWTVARVIVSTPDDTVVATQAYLHRDHYPDWKICESTYPWLTPPTLQGLNALFKKANQEKGTHLTATCNAVTAAMYRDNGAMMLQERSFVSSKTGEDILDPGMPGMHGGMIDIEDFMNTSNYAEVCKKASLREVYEEFGVNLTVDEIEHLGNVYDADCGRFNHVFATSVSYEDALELEYENNVKGMLSAIFNCEGIGRITNMFAADTLRAIETEAFTFISIKILKAFPSLTPPEKPV